MISGQSSHLHRHPSHARSASASWKRVGLLQGATLAALLCGLMACGPSAPEDPTQVVVVSAAGDRDQRQELYAGLARGLDWGDLGQVEESVEGSSPEAWRAAIEAAFEKSRLVVVVPPVDLLGFGPEPLRPAGHHLVSLWADLDEGQRDAYVGQSGGTIARRLASAIGAQSIPADTTLLVWPTEASGAVRAVAIETLGERLGERFLVRSPPALEEARALIASGKVGAVVALDLPSSRALIAEDFASAGGARPAFVGVYGEGTSFWRALKEKHVDFVVTPELDVLGYRAAEVITALHPKRGGGATLGWLTEDGSEVWVDPLTVDGRVAGELGSFLKLKEGGSAPSRDGVIETDAPIRRGFKVPNTFEGYTDEK